MNTDCLTAAQEERATCLRIVFEVMAASSAPYSYKCAMAAWLYAGTWPK